MLPKHQISLYNAFVHFDIKQQGSLMWQHYTTIWH